MTTARAPGRLDVMGGIADYSGSLVLQWPTVAQASATAEWADDERVVVATTDPEAAGGQPVVSLPLDSLCGSYEQVRAAFQPDTRWAAYVAGAITVLMQELGVVVDRGLRLEIGSEVPAGKGVSSSAAIEVAAMRAIAALIDVPLESRDIALLCQKVENLVVGAPCGVMDQMTAACGERGALLALLCQPAELQPPVTLPPDVQFVGIDSGIRHAVSGSPYTAVRVGAFMGYRIVAELAGLGVDVRSRPVRVVDPRWHGYLANLDPDEWATRFRDRVPDRMTGVEFLDRYRGTTDPVTVVEPDRDYAVRLPTNHPIQEHARVRRFRSLLQTGRSDDATLSALGELMFASHESYGACGLGSTGTDRLVELVRAAGPAAGVYGAKITGGGSGGTVAVLYRRGARPTVEQIAAEYRRETGRSAQLID